MTVGKVLCYGKFYRLCVCNYLALLYYHNKIYAIIIFVMER